MSFDLQSHSQVTIAQDYNWVSWLFDETNGRHNFWGNVNTIKIELGQTLEVNGLVVNFVYVGKTALVG